MPAWIWLAGALVLAIAEALGGEFVLLMLGAGALATAGVALLTQLLWLQLIVFAIVSVATVVLGRPALLRKFHVHEHTKTNVQAIVGSKAVVISTVDTHGGQVKIGGEVWSASGVDGHHPLPPGTPVTVVEVRGATAVVTWG